MAGVAPTMGRRRLGGVLKTLRLGAGLSNEQARQRASMSTAKLSRLETGHNVVLLKDVRALLDAYNADGKTRSKVLQLAQAAEQSGWWQQFDDVLPTDFDLYLSVEEAAASLLVFETSIMHGLLQTENYARAWLRAEDPGRPNGELERLVGLRMARRQALTRKDDPLTVWAVLDEAVFRRRVGGPEVMREQLKHLLTLCESTNVTIQILPFIAGEHVAASGSFTLVEFSEPTDPEIGYVDCAAGNVYPEKSAQVRRMKTNFHHLTSAALEPIKSLAFIRKVQRELT
ncbi:helix-turn-helix domain-containing protein [Saccharopolyspora spinosa]|uniref:Helix-turn-helix protein n=1 Tax=Saccharopolyspora spinosa TaxID=60894 RepID=A0A2N3Y8H6_SACSN|nr:helix-turn-helix transcriptional regulator [Saccharopolyspora spinosa]PKW19236.1 helix-turn-helix protein [Saccharopolyspora spinosa]